MSKMDPKKRDKREIGRCPHVGFHMTKQACMHGAGLVGHTDVVL